MDTKTFLLEEYNDLHKLYNEWISSKEPENIYGIFFEKLQNFGELYEKTKYLFDEDGVDKTHIELFLDKVSKNIHAKNIALEFTKSLDKQYLTTLEYVNNIEFDSKIKNVKLIDKSDARIIYKGMFRENELSEYVPCYMKIFYISKKTLGHIYEQHIYEYIKSKQKILEKYNNDFFMESLANFKMTKADFFEASFLKTDPLNMVDTFEKIKSEHHITTFYVIVTKDISAMTVSDYIFKYELFVNEKITTNIIFDIMYAIYLLNDKMKIMHNDLHFGNILIQPYVPEHKTTYIVGGKILEKNKTHKIYIYDYDLSCIYENSHMNPLYLLKDYRVLCKKTSKDVWTILNNMSAYAYDYSKKSMKYPLYLKELLNLNYLDNEHKKHILSVIMKRHPSFDMEDRSLNYINNIVNVIFNDNIDYKYKLLTTIGNYISSNRTTNWNDHCIDEVVYEIKTRENCLIADEPDLFPEQVLKRMINNDRIFECLDIDTVDNYYKKYIKYKTKYMNEKMKNEK